MKKIFLILILVSVFKDAFSQPGGVDCASAAINMVTLPFYQTGLSNCGSNNFTSANTNHCSPVGSSTYNYIGGDDRLYAFTVPAGVTDITINFSSNSQRVGLFLHNNCPTMAGSCVKAQSGVSGVQSFASSVTPGVTYYLVVSSWPNTIAPTYQCHNNFALSIVASVAGAPNTQDCLGAINMCQLSISQTQYYAGTGNIPNEINSGPSCLGSGEKNDVWYRFTALSSGTLNFSIIPNNMGDDYDWAVYDLSNAVCSDIYSNAALEIGCNYSGTSGITGPNGLTGAQNGPPINVVSGGTYVINVSQFSPSSAGFMFNTSASSVQILDNTSPSVSSISGSLVCGVSSIKANFSEPVRCSAFDVSKFVITDINATSYTINSINSSSCIDALSTTNQATLTVFPALTALGTYTLHTLAGALVEFCGGENSTTLISTFVVSPYTFNVIGNVTICSGQSTTLTAIGGGLSTYTWSNGNTGNPQIFNPTQTTTITVTGINPAGCSATIDKIITVNPIPILTITGDNFICVGETTTLTVDGATSYTWNNGGVNATQTFSPTSTSTVSVIGKIAGCQTSESYTITVEALPVLTLTGLANVCVGETTTYTVSGAASYTWNSGSITDTEIISPMNNTTLTVSGYSVNGCQNIINKNISVSSVNVSTTVNNNTISANEIGANYQWMDCNSNSIISGQTGKDFIATVNGSYAVIITQNNCSDTSACVVITTIGLVEKQKAQNEILLFPNPSNSGEITIKAHETIKVLIVNQLNQELQYIDLNEKNLFEATFTIVESGIYYLKGEGVYNKLVVIKE